MVKVDMTELEVDSNSLHRPDYLLSLAQVEITAYSSDEVPLLKRSPMSLCAEGNSAKMTNSKNKTLNFGAIFGVNPTGQIGFTTGQTSNTEKQVARWDVISSITIKASMQVDDKTNGASWRYIHNDAVFGRMKRSTFDTEHRPSALFGSGKVKPRVQVKVLAVWSSDVDPAHTGFPFRWRRVKEQMSVFTNFIHQLAVVVDANDLKDERSWFFPDTRVNNVKMEELSASKGPIHFKSETAAHTSSTEGILTDLKVLITKTIEGRAELTPAALMGDETSGLQ